MRMSRAAMSLTLVELLLRQCNLDIAPCQQVIAHVAQHVLLIVHHARKFDNLPSVLVASSNNRQRK